MQWTKNNMAMQPDQSRTRSDRANPHARDVQRVRDRYVRALIRGDEAEANDAVQEAISFEWRPATIYIGVLASAMVAIGEMWHDGEITVAHEHQATLVTLRQTSMLRQFFPPERKTGLHAIISAVERDGHMLGAMIFSDLLYFDGWNTDFLGAGTPARDLGGLVGERKPDLVALSATLDSSWHVLEECIESVRSAHRSTFIVIGGAAVLAAPEKSASLNANMIATSAAEAVLNIGVQFDVKGATIPLELILQKVGKQIKGKRIDRGWSQQQLAEAAGLDRTYLSGVEHGRQNLTLGAIKKIGDALNAPISEFIE